jgi:hypothetical protein
VRFEIIENGFGLINVFETSKFHYMNSGFVKGMCSSSSRGKWVAVCQHSMACRRVADGGPPPDMQGRTDVMNKHSRTAERGWVSGLGVGRDANNSLS